MIGDWGPNRIVAGMVCQWSSLSDLTVLLDLRVLAVFLRAELHGQECRDCYHAQGARGLACCLALVGPVPASWPGGLPIWLTSVVAGSSCFPVGGLPSW